MRSFRRFPIGLLAGAVFAWTLAAQTGSSPADGLDAAIAAAESRLRSGDLQGAEGHYREALFEGWLLRATLERLEHRLPEAREALGNASLFRLESPEALRSLASAQLQTGAVASALDILSELLRKTPTDTETLRLLAKSLAASGQLERAVETLDEASRAASDDPEALFLVATEYLWLKETEAAERLFARVVAARPIPQTRVLIGRCYRDAGEYARATAELRAALSQDPAVRRAHYYLGMVLLSDATTGADRLERAIAEFREELKLAPDDPPTNDQLGAALLDAGRPAEALPALETAVRGEARSAYAYHLGRCQLALDRPADAAASLRRALELARDQGAGAPEREKIHYQLGLALRKLGLADEAAAQMAQARSVAARGTHTADDGAAGGPRAAAGAVNELSPLLDVPLSQRRELKQRVTAGLARAYFNLGVLQAQSQRDGAADRFARAAAFFERAAGVDPDFPQVQSSWGIACFNARQFAQATGPLARALAADPKDAGLRRMLAMSWINVEAWEKAAELLEHDPERDADASLQLAYGLALLRSRRAEEAETILAGILAQRGDSAELRVLLGQAHAEQKDYDAAIESLQRAVQLRSDVAQANGTLGAVYLRQGRLSEAEDALRAELRARPDDVDSQQNLAVVLDRAHRREEAVTVLRGVVESRPDRAEARLLLGRMLLAQGDAAEAVVHLEAAARSTPDDADVREQLGRAYEKLGKAELAREQFEASRQLRARRSDRR